MASNQTPNADTVDWCALAITLALGASIMSFGWLKMVYALLLATVSGFVSAFCYYFFKQSMAQPLHKPLSVTQTQHPTQNTISESKETAVDGKGGNGDGKEQETLQEMPGECGAESVAEDCIMIANTTAAMLLCWWVLGAFNSVVVWIWTFVIVYVTVLAWHAFYPPFDLAGREEGDVGVLSGVAREKGGGDDGKVGWVWEEAQRIVTEEEDDGEETAMVRTYLVEGKELGMWDYATTSSILAGGLGAWCMSGRRLPLLYGVLGLGLLAAMGLVGMAFRFGYFKHRRRKLDTYTQVVAGHEEASASLQNLISSGIFGNNDSGHFPKQAHEPSTAYHHSHPLAPKKPYIVTYPRDQHLLTLEDHLELLCLEMHEFMLTMFDTGAYMTSPLKPNYDLNGPHSATQRLELEGFKTLLGMLNEEGPLLSLEFGDSLTEWCKYTGNGWDPHKPNEAGKGEKGGWDVATALEAFGERREGLWEREALKELGRFLGPRTEEGDREFYDVEKRWRRRLEDRREILRSIGLEVGKAKGR